MHHIVCADTAAVRCNIILLVSKLPLAFETQVLNDAGGEICVMKKGESFGEVD
jgi:hypothetical protein